MFFLGAAGADAVDGGLVFAETAGHQAAAVDAFRDKVFHCRFSAPLGKRLIISVVAAAVGMGAKLNPDVRIEFQVAGQFVEGRPGVLPDIPLVEVIVNIFQDDFLVDEDLIEDDLDLKGLNGIFGVFADAAGGELFVIGEVTYPGSHEAVVGIFVEFEGEEAVFADGHFLGLLGADRDLHGSSIEGFPSEYLTVGVGGLSEDLFQDITFEDHFVFQGLIGYHHNRLGRGYPLFEAVNIIIAEAVFPTGGEVSDLKDVAIGFCSVIDDEAEVVTARVDGWFEVEGW